ncbi:actin depolymerizing protein [Trichodelitschia bisporula]|uniref:Actin depolymerizing protein n=1 Tax=Trichodelitschia bisporula TaxID=703511 RepID=A0A6G1HY15_9PEZI|nr:actin depolymerizing protein [Trichodelitschia bisporula]
MQSGITAARELHDAFTTFQTDPSKRALLISIQCETLVPTRTLDSTPSFDSDLSTLSSLLTPTEALYILLRPPTTNSLVTITYVPDAAPVRQKTLFASTRLTLTRELGGEHFGDSIFATTANEVGPEGWARHEAHGKADAPLTAAERDLEDIRAAEAAEVGGTERRGAGYGPAGGFTMANAGSAVDALKALGPGGLVVLRIGQDERIVLEDEGTPVREGVQPGDVARYLSADEPRYAVYGYGGAGELKPVFIYTCPTQARIKDKMLYASSRRSAEALAKSAGGDLAKKIEASDPSEITAGAIEEEFAVKEETKTGFSKPKRPGRR